MSGEYAAVDDDGRTSFEYWVDRLAADLPWGVIAFAAVAIGGLVWSRAESLSPGDYLAAVGSGSGLPSIGHGFRTLPR